MAWNPNIPTVTNRIQDDLDAIRENFRHLDPLAPYVQALLNSRIVEMGSNSNGTYVRWENGLQVCWASLNLGPITYGSGSLADMYRTNLYNRAFPAVFTAPPVIGVAAWREDAVGGEAVVGAFCRGIAKDVIRFFQGWSGAMSDKDIYASWIAIGRWK